METINFLRLKTGDDIVSYVYYRNDEQVVLRDPMLIVMKPDYKSGNQIVGMDSWLPYQIMHSNEVFIKISDVLFISKPSAEFEEFYENTVDKIKVKEDDDKNEDESKLTSEEMLMILDAIENKEGLMHWLLTGAVGVGWTVELYSLVNSLSTYRMVNMSKHYINNADFCRALSEYKALVKDAKENDREKPAIPNYIGECFLKIAEHLSQKF